VSIDVPSDLGPGLDAGDFLCGTAECTVDDYCTITTGGSIGSSYACVALPTACLTTPTCDCLLNQGNVTGTCSIVGGHPVVSH